MVLFWSRHNLTGTSQRQVNVVTDVLLAQQLVEAVALQHCLYLGYDTREHDGDTFFLAHQTEVLQVVQARAVDKRHLTHTDDAHLGPLAVASHDVLETVTGTEEVGTIDLVDLHALGDGQVLQIAGLHVGILVQVDLVVDHLHVGSLRHTLHKEQAGTDDTHLDGNGEVEDDSEQEGDDEHSDVALRVAHQGLERAPSTHAIAHDDKHAGQTGHRDVLCQGHEQQEDEQQYHSMDNARNGRTSTIINIGHGAGDGSRSRYATK